MPNISGRHSRDVWLATDLNLGEKPHHLLLREVAGVFTEGVRQLVVASAVLLDVSGRTLRVKVPGTLGGRHASLYVSLESHADFAFPDGLATALTSRATRRGLVGIRKRRRFLRIGVSHESIQLGPLIRRDGYALVDGQGGT